MSSSSSTSTVNNPVDPQLHSTLQDFQTHLYTQVQQQLQQFQQQNTQTNSVSSSQPQHIVITQKPPLAPHEPWEGTIGLGINDWLESLESQHVYYERDDLLRINATVALLKGSALKEYNISSKVNPPKTYVDLCKLLRERWNFVETEFFVRKSLNTLIQRGPAMSTSKYSEEFQRLAHRLPSDTSNALLFQYILGLRPSIRVKVHERNHKSFHEAMLQVLKLDATWSAHNTSSSSSSSSYQRSNDSNDLMDISNLHTDEDMSAADRKAILSAQGLSENDITTPSSNIQPSNNNSTVNALQTQINHLTQQLSSINLSGRPPFKKNNFNNKKNGNNNSSHILNQIPLNIRKMRELYGLCMKCGVVKYTRGETGHNSSTCTNQIDKTTVPNEFKQGKMPPSFQ